MGVSVYTLFEMMPQKELLHHIEDLRHLPPEIEAINLMIGRQSKLILDCSEVDSSSKKNHTVKDLMVKFGNGVKKLTLPEIKAKARAQKWSIKLLGLEL